jgi:hypothetical protein
MHTERERERESTIQTTLKSVPAVAAELLQSETRSHS